MKGNNMFKLLCLLQVWVVIALVRYCVVLGEQSKLFQDVDEFLPAKATCIESDRRRYGSYRNRRTRYNNTYRYTVNEQTYTVTYYSERWRGSDKVLYYNPTNPNVVSKYSSYADAATGNAIWIIFVVIGQSVIIFFAVKATRGQNAYQEQSVGVVLGDDFQFDMNNDASPYTDRISSSQKEETQEKETIAFPGWNSEGKVESIPFRPSKTITESNQTDDVETIAFTRSTKPKDDFVLYTEEEYKQMQKEK
ncbi:MAG: hypothetical protein E7264_05535 [Lachnospiraceae bacterium]|nr:hypothetical protein [Lachnospiraceae bacterium]